MRKVVGPWRFQASECIGLRGDVSSDNLTLGGTQIVLVRTSRDASFEQPRKPTLAELNFKSRAPCNKVEGCLGSALDRPGIDLGKSSGLNVDHVHVYMHVL